MEETTAETLVAETAFHEELEQRAALLGLTLYEYLVGVLERRYPPIPKNELRAVVVRWIDE